ncbi:hypothetical protein ADL04_01535 [Streptomyces sp. NRRL B-3648]|nr:hypothetical protein [Streptomyces sp. NRRL B-3648]KOX11574.1 hypothetical protein ADL04_01535 [Streptomyces sp. NRRL B-3648]
MTLWGRRKAVVDAINHTHVNADYLPQTSLPSAVRATTGPAEAAGGDDIAVLAVSAQPRTLLEGWADQWQSHARVTDVDSTSHHAVAPRQQALWVSLLP